MITLESDPIIIETEIDETTNEVVGTYPCGCVRTQRLRWMKSRDGSISARPSISSDATERCELHRS